MAENPEHNSRFQSDGEDNDDVPRVSIVPLVRLQGTEEQSDSSQPGPSTSNPTKIRLDFTQGTPKKGTPTTPRKKAVGITPKKKTPKKSSSKASVPKSSGTKAPARRRKSRAEKAGMKEGAILKYFRPTPKIEAQVVQNTVQNEILTTENSDEVETTVDNSVALDLSHIDTDKDGEATSGTDLFECVTTDEKSGNDISAAAGIYSDISDDENSNVETLKTSLILLSSASIFCTPDKLTSSNPSQPTRLQNDPEMSPVPATVSTAAIEQRTNASASDSVRHIRNLNFDNNEPAKPVEPIQTSKNGVEGQNLPSTSGNCPGTERIPMYISNIPAAKSAKPNPKRFGPPRQKDAEQIKLRIEAHRKRMEEEGATLREAGVYLSEDEDDSSTKSPEPAQCLRIRSPGHSGIGLNPVKTQRRRNKRKFTRVKRQGRRDSLDSLGSTSSAGSSKPLKRKSSGLDGNEESAKANKRPHLEGKRNSMSPRKLTAVELGSSIDKCFLKRRVSATKQEQSAALERIKNVLEEPSKIPVLLSAFEWVNTNAQVGRRSYNSYWTVVAGLFDTAVKEAQVRRAQTKDESTVKFLELLYDIMEQSYREYSKQRVKVWLPLLAIIVQGPHPETAPTKVWQRNVKENFESILEFAFSLYKDPSAKVEREVVMKWLNLIIRHYHGAAERVGSFIDEISMIESFLKYADMASPATDYGLSVLKRTTVPEFARSICEAIIVKVLEINQLKRKRGDYGVETERPDCVPFLSDLARSNLILERFDAVETAIPRTVQLNCVNRKGETALHIACAKSVEALTIEVALLLNASPDNTRNINAKDFAGNTCFHDSAYHGKLEIIEYLAKWCYRPDEKPGRTNMDLFSRTDEGNTAVHLAVKQAKVEARGRSASDEYLDTSFPVVRKLIEMICSGSKAQKNLAILFQIRDNVGKTVRDVVPNPDSDFGRELTAYLEGVRSQLQRPDTFGGIWLQPRTIRQIRRNSKLQTVVAYWEHFHAQVPSS